MKHNIIKTNNYLLVVDESEIKEGDFYLRYNNSVLRCTQLKESFNEALNKNEIIIFANGCGDPYERSRGYLKKIIAYLPLNNSPILEGVPLLPPLGVEDDVFTDAQEYAIESGSSNKEARRKGYVDGYNKAKEKYRFTEKHLSIAIALYMNNKSFSEIIQSLSQPEIPIGFECERISDIPSKEVMGEFDSRPKTIINSQSQTVWVGKYIY